MRLAPASSVGHPSRVFISAGEVSGDIAGSYLAQAILRIDPEVELSGVGGERMKRAGVEVLFDTNHLGSVGLSEPLSTLPGLTRTVRAIRSHLSRSRPDVAVLIGHEVFHMFVARWLKGRGIPTVSYFPPQVWLWGKVARWIAPGFDRILSSFPEEHDVYQEVGGRSIFVGHYLKDVIGPADSDRRQDIRRRLQLGARDLVVGLFPGSRVQEIRMLLPLFLDVAQDLLERDRSLRFVLPIADEFYEAEIRALVAQRRLDDRIRLCFGGRDAMIVSDLLLLCSGTATLEATILGRPMVIAYRLTSISRAAVRLLRAICLIDTDAIGLPNLLARAKVVPELCLGEIHASSLAHELWSILEDPSRQIKMSNSLLALSDLLGEKGSLERAALAVLGQAPRAESMKESTRRT